MCIEQKINKQLNDNKRRAKSDMGNQCQQYGILSIAPSRKHKTLNQVNIVKEAFTKIKALKPANITTKVENLIKKSNKNYKDKKPDKFDKRKIKCFRSNKYSLVVSSNVSHGRYPGFYPPQVWLQSIYFVQ